MTYCPVANQIAINSHMSLEVDERSDAEIFAELRVNGKSWVNGEMVEMYRITDSIDDEDYKEAGQKSLVENGDALYDLYIEAIKEFRS